MQDRHKTDRVNLKARRNTRYQEEQPRPLLAGSTVLPTNLSRSWPEAHERGEGSLIHGCVTMFDSLCTEIDVWLQRPPTLPASLPTHLRYPGFQPNNRHPKTRVFTRPRSEAGKSKQASPPT